MKKLIFAIVLFLSFFNVVEALENPNTFQRTNSDLKVNKNYNIDENNMKNVMLTPSVDSSSKIYDFANILTTNYKSLADNFINKYKMDMVIVTINKNDNGNAKTFGQDFYDYNDFGLEYKYYSGILLIIDLDRSANNGDRKVEIVTTGEAIRLFNDQRIDNILDSMMDYLYSGDYAGASKEFIEQCSYYASLGLPNSAKDYYFDEEGNIQIRFRPNYLVYLIISFLTSSITLWVLTSKNKMIKKFHPAKDYLKDKNVEIFKKDNFVRSHTTHTTVSSSSGSSGGGGSSFGSGSSGGSHGGGGRSF